jgi:glycosyltransferase involved in cell wall biosynthesis
MKVAFFSVNCLQDAASGAARSVRTILEGLAARGHEALSVTAGCFDAPDHDDEATMFATNGFSAQGVGVWNLQLNSVEHVGFETGSLQVSRVTARAMKDLVERALERLDAFQPDVVLSYGGTAADSLLRVEMGRRGVAQVFYLANPQYKSIDTFQSCDLILCDSRATAELYKERLGLLPVPIGKFIEPIEPIPNEKRRYVTFINPIFEKGVTLFFRIAEMMRQQLPDVMFQVVESRSTLGSIEAKTGLPFSHLENIRAISLQRDMTRVLSRTKVLLVPSLWHESGPRVGLEAMSLGIPVLGSNHSGLKENIGEGGILFDVPQKMRDDPRLIPPLRVALPWVATLQDLMTDDASYAAASAVAHRFWQDYAATDRIGPVEALLAEVVAGR